MLSKDFAGALLLVAVVGTTPAVAGRCEAYGDRMHKRVEEAKQRNCTFLKPGGSWDKHYFVWVRQCYVLGKGRPITENERGLLQNLNDCKNGGGSDLRNARVLKDVDVYDKPGGNGKVIGSLNAGTKVGTTGCKSGWCFVRGQGAERGGYVYSAADYRSLQQ